MKNNLIAEWETQTGQVWPTYKNNLLNKEGTIIAKAGDKAQVHHIIPQQVGGPHQWWNVHPLEIPDHQSGVHATNSILNKILKSTQ